MGRKGLCVATCVEQLSDCLSLCLGHANSSLVKAYGALESHVLADVMMSFEGDLKVSNLGPYLNTKMGLIRLAK